MVTKTGVVYLQKDKLQVYSPYLASIVEFRFVPEVVRDLDIVNKNLLENLIKAFITNAKIPPGNLIFVLADNTYFIKDFVIPPTPTQPNSTASVVPQVTMEQLQESAEQYIEHVPYDSVVSKTFPLKNGLRVCAVNQEFFSHINNAFEKNGFTVISVLPGLIFGNNLTARPVLDAGLAQLALQKVGSFKQYDLLNQEVFIPESEKMIENKEEVEFEEQKNKPNKKRLYVMIGVFVVLLAVLGFMVAPMIAPPSPKSIKTPMVKPVGQAEVKPASTNAATPIYTLAPTRVPDVVPTINTEQEVKNIKVQIAVSSGEITKAQVVKTELSKLGFAVVNVQTTSGLVSPSTVLSFSEDIPQSVRNTVLAIVDDVSTGVNVQERQNETTAISIIMGTQ